MLGETVPISWLLEILFDLGLDREALLDRAGLSPEALDPDQDLSLSLSDYNDIFSFSGRALNEPCLGLALLDHISAENFGLIGLLASSGPTLKQSLLNLSKYQPIFSPLFVWSLDEGPTQTRLIYEVRDCKPEHARFDIEISLGVVTGVINGLPSTGPGVVEAEFAFRPPDDLTRYHECFGVDVIFDSKVNSTTIRSDLLGSTFPGADPRVSGILESQAKAVLDDLSDKPDLVRQVEATIALGLGQEAIGIASVANRLYMHPRTLHRRLIQHGTSFRQLRDNIVIKSAQDALLQTSMSVTDIAFTLGYSESSAFSRTFKRVCDISPSQYRRIGQSAIPTRLH